MVQTITEPAPAEPDLTAPQRRIGVLGLLAALLVGLVLGYLGWVLPTPGGSLVAPTAVVGAVGGGLLLISWVAACFRPAKRDLWTFAVAVTACTVLAAVWTFELSLPVAMALDGNATPQAQRALLQAQHAPTNARGIPLYSCTTVETGSIGPLSAPYKVCPILGTADHIVLYTAIGASPVRGIGYTDVGAAAFPDECSRHLVGPWWMFVGDGGGGGPCPFGYRFHGGP